MDKKEISVTTTIDFFIDAQGKASVKDTKILKNNGIEEVVLEGPFRQAIRNNVPSVKVYDSSNIIYPAKIIRGGEYHQVEVNIQAPDGKKFVIEPKAERSLTIEYEAPGYMKLLNSRTGSVCLITNRFGNIGYAYNFTSLSFNCSYKIEKIIPSHLFKRWFNTYEIICDPNEMTVKEDKRYFYITYVVGIDVKEGKYIHILISFIPRTGVFAIAGGIIGSLGAAVILRIFQLIFGTGK